MNEQSKDIFSRGIGQMYDLLLEESMIRKDMDWERMHD